jgi:hypothetical protein
MVNNNISIVIFRYGQIRGLVARNTLIEHLSHVSEISNVSLTSDQEDLLLYLCKYTDITAYKIYRLNALNKTEILRDDMDDRVIRKSIEGLESKKLIERSKKGSSMHCRVTLGGIVYLILRRKILLHNTIKWVFKNYGDNVLFQQILYPYIGKDTITGLTFFNSLSPVALFLHDCCAAIVSSIESTYLPENKDLMQLILSSKAAPQDARQTQALVTFLKQRFNLDWVDKAKVILEKENALRITYGFKSILIRLYNSNTKAVLTVKKKRKILQFVVELFPNDYLVRTKSLIREKSLESVLSAVIAQKVPIFIFSLASNAPASSEDFRTLSKDKNFMKILECTRNNFDRQHELFLKEQNNQSSL